MGSAKILIVEDEIIVAKDIQNRLTQVGYDVAAIIDTGEEAIKQSARIFPDLILMDIRLKGNMDGIEAAAKIYGSFNIPIVYLTANADEETVSRAKMTEPFGYLIKPFKTRELQTIIEITIAKHQIEKKLKESEQWLSTVLKSIGEAVITSDRQGTITFINPVAQALTGWKESDVLGKEVTEVFNVTYQETRTLIESSSTPVLQSGVAVGLLKQTILVAKNGKEIPINHSITSIRDDSGNITGMILVFQDISERKQAEEAICVALEKEKELNELKSRFTAMTSHEFRTPLSTILSSAELLERYSHKWSEEKKLNHLQRIQFSVKHMTELLNDVLLIGQAEAGKLEFNPTPLDLIQFCHVLVEELQLATSTHTINFLTQDQYLYACMDEKLLRHILNNLLSNAIKYSPEGSTVNFKLVNHQEEVIFNIQDQGIGIPLAEQSQLFSSFYRASNVGSISGTGLGLAIVKKSVDLHDGKISVVSEVGVGTTFKVTLPLKTGA